MVRVEVGMTYRVEIRECLKQFHCAHEAILESLGGAPHLAETTTLDPKNTDAINVWDLINEAWQIQHHAQLGPAKSQWKYLDFDSEAQYTLFLLRWS